MLKETYGGNWEDKKCIDFISGKKDGIWTHKIIFCRLKMDTCVPVHLMFDGLSSFSVVQIWGFHEEKEFCVGFCK